jgi:hypothetical protein
MSQLTNTEQLKEFVLKIVRETPVFDIHTHLYSPPFGDLLLWGVDELITYHYLVAEFFRYSGMTVEQFHALDKKQQAEAIWQELFIEHSPISESNRGVLTALHSLGLDVGSRDLESVRSYFAGQNVEKYIDKVFELAGIEAVVMTNDPFDDSERPVWLENRQGTDKRFKAALRIDPLLMDWENAAGKLKKWGYNTGVQLSEKTLAEVRRFLCDWVERMNPLYMAVSLPPTFRYPEDSKRAKIIENCIIPVTREKKIPFAMMIGVKKLVNPALGLAGDSVGRADVAAVEALARRFPENKFLVTFLSRENQHEACITTRKFRNVMLFGCWWFMNNPSIIREITSERLELLGTSFVPQHSDARVLDQLIYKWEHSRELIGEILAEKYEDIRKAGWQVIREDVVRDVHNLFGENFKRFVGLD